MLVLFATAGMMMLAAARDLMIIFLGIELMSVAVYVLAGLNRRSATVRRRRDQVFPARRVLDGIPALRHRARVRRDRIDELVDDRRAREQFQLGDSPMLLAGIALLLVGFGFKVAAAPFHMWAPDVYEGAPTPVTGYMAAAVKAAAFAAFLRVWLEAFAASYTRVARRGVVARGDHDGRRATSSRSRSRISSGCSRTRASRTPGSCWSRSSSARPQASSAFLFYLFAYTLATMGAFAVIVALGQPGEGDLTIDRLLRPVERCGRGWPRR